MRRLAAPGRNPFGSGGWLATDPRLSQAVGFCPVGVDYRWDTTMALATLHDLFVHDLEDMYYAENELLDALSTLAEQTEDEEIAEAFESHREETQEHVDRLEQVFEMLDREPESEECDGIDGLIEEHEGFVEEDPDQKVLDLHNLVAAQKTEHYEIAAYGNMAIIADRLEMDDASDLINQNLEEEREALEKLSQHVDDFDFEVVQGAASAD
jgi:ferritin-like metal-binding protein YciE